MLSLEVLKRDFLVLKSSFKLLLLWPVLLEGLVLHQESVHLTVHHEHHLLILLVRAYSKSTPFLSLFTFRTFHTP